MKLHVKKIQRGNVFKFVQRNWHLSYEVHTVWFRKAMSLTFNEIKYFFDANSTHAIRFDLKNYFLKL